MSGRELVFDAEAVRRLGLRRINRGGIDKSAKLSFSSKDENGWGRTSSKR